MEKARSNDFTGMNRNYRSSSVFVPKKMMAATDARHFKAGPAERVDQITAGTTRSPTHAAMLTR